MTEDVKYGYYSDVARRDVDWLWYPYIPCGKITILQGDPGEGKSTFILRLTSILTNGGIFPDGTKLSGPHTVIYQCAEDSMEDTIKPRLLEAGADCTRVAFINDPERNLTLDDARIRNVLQITGARMLILDPIQAFIPPDCDMQSAQKVREVMRNLAAMAEECGCAVVLISHMNKAGSGKAIYRGLGSIDFAAIARSILMIVRDEEDTSIRYMYPIKSSLAPEGHPIGFIMEKELGFRWIGVCEKTDSSAVFQKGSGKKKRAEKLLRSILSIQDIPSANIICKMEQMGISERTTRAAGKAIGVNSVKKGSVWYWHLDETRAVLEVEG